MKELIENIRLKNDFYKKILKNLLNKNLNILTKYEIDINNKTYVFQNEEKENIILIDNLNGNGEAILEAELIANEIFRKLGINTINTTYICFYQNCDLLTIQIFKFNHFSCDKFSGFESLLYGTFTKNDIKKILGENK